jgi:hypothetical protein
MNTARRNLKCHCTYSQSGCCNTYTSKRRSRKEMSYGTLRRLSNISRAFNRLRSLGQNLPPTSIGHPGQGPEDTGHRWILSERSLRELYGFPASAHHDHHAYPGRSLTCVWHLPSSYLSRGRTERMAASSLRQKNYSKVSSRLLTSLRGASATDSPLRLQAMTNIHSPISIPASLL